VLILAPYQAHRCCLLQQECILCCCYCCCCCCCCYCCCCYCCCCCCCCCYCCCCYCCCLPLLPCSPFNDGGRGRGRGNSEEASALDFPLPPFGVPLPEKSETCLWDQGLLLLHVLAGSHGLLFVMACFLHWNATV